MICLICGESFESKDYNALWDDKLFHGRPICDNCSISLEDNPNLNIDPTLSPIYAFLNAYNNSNKKKFTNDMII